LGDSFIKSSQHFAQSGRVSPREQLFVHGLPPPPHALTQHTVQETPFPRETCVTWGVFVGDGLGFIFILMI